MEDDFYNFMIVFVKKKMNFYQTGLDGTQIEVDKRNSF